MTVGRKAASQLTPKLRHRLLLLVEDSDELRAIISDRLRMEEYEVAEATSGIGAVVMLGEQRFDLVIMDILLPNMRGDHVRKVAIERLGYGEVPFLFISAFLMPEGLCPYEDFFYKPLDLKRLLQRIDEILGGPYVVEGQEHGSRG